MTEQPHQSSVKTEQPVVPSVVKTESDYLYIRVSILHTHTTNTECKTHHRTTFTAKPTPHMHL